MEILAIEAVHLTSQKCLTMTKIGYQSTFQYLGETYPDQCVQKFAGRYRICVIDTAARIFRFAQQIVGKHLTRRELII